jgi:uncharacterized membrane protein
MYRAHGNKRILTLDAARGTAMLLACLAHFAWWMEVAYPSLSLKLATIGLVATPTFMVLSGSMIGLKAGRAGLVGTKMRLDLIDRGIFLIIVAHLLIAVAEVHRSGTILQRLEQFNSVDEIGIGCILFGAFHGLALKSMRVLLAFAFGLACLGWALALAWHPLLPTGEVVEELLVGQLTNNPIIDYACPMAPFLALFVAGVVLGKFVAEREQQGRLDSIAAPLCLFGVALAGAALAAHLGYRWAAMRGWAPADGAWHASVVILRKMPPSPGYLVFFTGLALLMFGLLTYLRRAAHARWLLEWLAIIGQVSLFVFVLQYFVFWTLPDLLRLKPGSYFPLLFASQIALLWFMARWWGRIGGNRWMRVGLRSRTTA